MKEIGIYSIGVVSSAGIGSKSLFSALESANSLSSLRSFEGEEIPVFSISEQSDDALLSFRSENLKLKRSDRVTLLGAYSASQALYQSNFRGERIGLNFGSSRGATSALERYMQDFLTGERLPPVVSPLTTAGGVSSTIASVIGVNELSLSHSVTCSTGLHSLLNSIQWIRAGEVSHFIAGAAEAPLTPFTIAQMKALSLYSDGGSYPCRPIEKGSTKNTFVLGEGAVSLALSDVNPEIPPHAVIESFGYAQEFPESPTGISKDGDGFKRSMEMALSRLDTKSIDMLFLHAPGTLEGDNAELSAIRKVFGDNVPYLMNTKWCTGHTFSVSGLLSVVAAIECLKRDVAPLWPYEPSLQGKKPTHVSRIMINSAGFGGNFVSLVLKRR